MEFDEKRVRILRKNDEGNEYGISHDTKGIVYWMFRDVRVEGINENLLNN